MVVRRNLFLRLARIFILCMGMFFVAGIIALSQIDLEKLRGNLISILRDSTGVPVQIDGAISWKLSLRPQVELNKVYVANASWATHKNAFSAKKIDVSLNLISLFRDRPTIQKITVYDADVCVEKNSNGEYSVARLDSGKKDNVTDGGALSKYPIKELGLGAVEIKKLKAHIINEDYSFAGVNVQYENHSDNREYSGWLKSNQGDVFPFIVTLSEYNKERKVYPVRVALSIGGDALISNIALECTSKIPIDFVVKGSVSDVSKLGSLLKLNLDNWPSVALNVAGGMNRKKITLRKSSVAFNGVNIDVSGDYDWRQKIPVLNVVVNANDVDVYNIFSNLGTRQWIRPKRDLVVFKDTPLYGKFFVDKTVNVKVDVKKLIVYRDFSLDNIDLKLNVLENKGRLLLNTNISEGDIRIASDIDIESDGKLNVVFGGIGEHMYIGDMLNQLRSPDLISELPVNFEIYVRANGYDLSELMQTATGPVRVYSVGAGYAHSALVAYMYGTDFLTSLRHSIQDLFNSEKKYNQIKISCAAVNAKLRDGRIETEQGVAVETNAINMRLAGNLDLGQEKMRLALTTVPVRGIKLSLTGKVVNSIELSGSLAEPDIAISGAAVAGKVASATGIGLLLAPFTGGIGLVAGAGVGWLAGDLLENWLADNSPCKTALERGAPVYRGDEEWLGEPISELVSGVLNK